MLTYEDRFSSDGSILWFYVELATFADLLALFLLLAIGQAILLNFGSDKCHLFCRILKGKLETCIFAFDIDDHLDVILVDSGLVLDDEGEGEGLLRAGGHGAEAKDSQEKGYYLGSHKDWFQY